MKSNLATAERERRRQWPPNWPQDLVRAEAEAMGEADDLVVVVVEAHRRSRWERFVDASWIAAEAIAGIALGTLAVLAILWATQ